MLLAWTGVKEKKKTSPHFFSALFFWVHLSSNLGASEMSECFVLLKLHVSKNVISDYTYV